MDYQSKYILLVVVNAKIILKIICNIFLNNNILYIMLATDTNSEFVFHIFQKVVSFSLCKRQNYKLVIRMLLWP